MIAKLLAAIYKQTAKQTKSKVDYTYIYMFAPIDAR